MFQRLASKLPSGKAEYTLEEAASALGISAAELESLVTDGLQAETPDVRNLERMRFRPADLIMLNMVHAARAAAAAK